MTITFKKRGSKRVVLFGATIPAKERARLVRLVRAETNGKRIKALRKSDTASGSGHVRFAFPEIAKKVQRRGPTGQYGKRVLSR